MMLSRPPYLEARKLINLAHPQGVEGDLRPHGRQGNGKKRLALLGREGCFEAGMESVDFDPVAGNVGGSEKREALDVVPVKMGQKEVEDASGA